MSKVFVTGAAGMLGTEVVAALSGGFELTCVDVEDFDIIDETATLAAVSTCGPDVVVNCAAYTDVDGAEAHESTAVAVNARGAGNVARAAAAVGARVIHFSTDYVFDGSSTSPYSEDDATHPLGAYGRSKLAGEIEVRAATDAHLIVRTSWLYGRSGANFVEKMLDVARKKGHLKVVDDQVGAPTYARDLAGILKELLELETAGVVNATNAGYCSRCEFAREIMARTGQEEIPVEAVTTAEFPSAAPRPAYSVLSLEKLRGLLGRAPRPWQEALADYLAER